ncbi:hypothetical protein CLM62_08110 [Streptomyces sp. SA15]|nr:hypothetical protein CLM62_08110 [Streptomyces sp. SA15]
MPWVRPYVRSDGTPVRGHSRWAPGARREMGILAAVAVAVLVMGGEGGAATGSSTGTSQQPRPAASYPVTFEGLQEQAARPAPQPTVSYPIRFPKTEKNARPLPTPTVSYPIPWAGGDQ